MTISKTMGLIPWALLLLLSVLWGGSFFLMKVAVLEMPALSIVWSRVVIGALCLLVLLKISGKALPKGSQVWLLFICLGVFNNIIPFSLLIFGMTEISSGLASILNATTPVFTIIVAHFTTADERFSYHKLVGVLLGVLGVALLLGVDIFSESPSILPMLACIGAAMSYAIAAIFGRQFKRLAIEPSSGAFGQLCASSVLLLPIMLVVDKPLQHSLPSAQTISAVVILGMFSTALAYVLFFKLIDMAGATNAVLVTLLVPVSAVLLGWFFLNERLSIDHLFAMLLIGAGLIAIDGRCYDLVKRRLT